MSLAVLIKHAQQQEDTLQLPDWVSSKNKSLAAYEYIGELKKERLEYIASHNLLTHYKKKGLYQITASEVAREIEVAVPTLTKTSAYSDGLKKYLDDVNLQLEDAKNKKIETHKNSLAGGLRQRKKDELRVELQEAKKELEELKQQNAIEQARYVLEKLPLPIRQKLGLDV